MYIKIYVSKVVEFDIEIEFCGNERTEGVNGKIEQNLMMYYIEMYVSLLQKKKKTTC